MRKKGRITDSGGTGGERREGERGGERENSRRRRGGRLRRRRRRRERRGRKEGEEGGGRRVGERGGGGRENGWEEGRSRCICTYTNSLTCRLSTIHVHPPSPMYDGILQ